MPNTEDLATRAARILGTDHPDAGSLAGDLAAALSEVERLRAIVAGLMTDIDTMELEAKVAGEYDYD